MTSQILAVKKVLTGSKMKLNKDLKSSIKLDLDQIIKTISMSES